MKFYIAAYIEEKSRVQALYAQLSNLGHTITVDWTDELAPLGEDRDRHAKQVEEIAVRDMEGVREAEVFILLSEPTEGRSKYAELGAAIMSYLERGKPSIYVLGEEANQSVFFYHPSVKRVKTLEEVVQHIET